MIKLSGKMDKSLTKCLVVIFHSLLKVSDLSIFPLIFIFLSDSSQSTISPYIYIYIYNFS